MVARAHFELLAGPSTGPVSLAEAKAHARVEHDADDTLLAVYLKAAEAKLQIGYGLAFGAQSWRATWTRSEVIRGDLTAGGLSGQYPIGYAQGHTATFARPRLERDPAHLLSIGRGLSLRPHPVGALTAVLVDGVDATDRFRILRGGRAETLHLQRGATLGYWDELTATYSAGFATAPDDLRLAILQTAAHWYEHREPTTLGANAQSAQAIPGNAAALLSAWAPVRLA